MGVADSMCDDLTERDNSVHLAQMEIDRRRFAAIGVGVAGLAMVPGALAQGLPAVADQTPAAPVHGRMVTIRTEDGACDAWFVTPVSGKHPAVIVWPDIAGLRDAYKTMGARLAGQGYAVLVVNHYYRASRSPVLESFAQWRTPEGQAKLKPMIEQITPAGTLRDARAFVEWLDQQGEVDTARHIGTSGYCMGGPYTIRTAYAAPTRVAAAASFHGAGLVVDGPDSPHHLFPKTMASYLFAIAQNDDARMPNDKVALRRATSDAHRKAEIEVYPAQHGWCTIDTPVYDREQAEKAWARQLALFKASL